MGIVWWMQGAFNALIHLVAVILAGSIGLALWEPMTLGFLIKHQPSLAWCVGLLGPFLLALFAIRVAFNLLIPSPLHMPEIVSGAVGAALGVVSGALTAGMVVIGISFLPMGVSLGGYQPLVLAGDGQVIRNPESKLWIPVDRMASGVFNSLSSGSLGTSTPLRRFVPSLDKQAFLYRLRRDDNQSLVAVPGSVRVEQVLELNTASKEIDELSRQRLMRFLPDNATLVLVETSFAMDEKHAGTFDSDRTLRLPATQVRLSAWSGVSHALRGELVAPLAILHLPPGSSTWQVIPNDNPDAGVTGVNPTERIAFAFRIDPAQQARHLFVRRLRLDLPDEVNRRVDDAVTLLGGEVKAKPAPSDPVTADVPAGPVLGERQGHNVGVEAITATISNAVPVPFSKNNVTAFTYDENQLRSGNADVPAPRGVVLSRANRLDAIYVPGHQAMVRIELDENRASTLLGKSIMLGAQVGEVWIQDNFSQIWRADSYVILRSDRSQRIRVAQEIRFAKELPINDMRPGDQLYLYFPVRRGVTVTSFHIGADAKYDLNLEVP